MVCDTFESESGRIWMCGRKLERAVRCSIKGCHKLAEALCDYPVGNDKTCDRKLCKGHKIAIAHEMDYCPTHKKMYDKFNATGKVEWLLSEVVPLHIKRGES